MRLLLATAESNLRLSLELLFSEQPGVKIVGTASESDGLWALIQIIKPDMVIADWHLPGRPLLEILLEIFNLSQRPRLIILADRDSDYLLAQNAGADAVVLMGASPDLLLSAFTRLRKKSNPKQENESDE